MASKTDTDGARSTYSPETLAMLEALGERPIAYHRAFARAWSINAAILLGQLIYWHGKQADADGWIGKTVSEIAEETALTERQQETARAELVADNAIEYKRRGLPARPYYRINHSEIARKVLAAKAAEKAAEKAGAELDRTKRPNKENADESADLDSAKGANQLGQNVLSSEDVSSGDLIGQNVLTCTENTTEITNQEITAEITAETTEESGACAPAPAPSFSTPADSIPASDAPATETTATGAGSGALGQAPEHFKREPGDTAPANLRTMPAPRKTARESKRGGKKSPANFTEHEDNRVQLYLTYILPEITPSNAELILRRVSAEHADEWEAAIAEHATGKGRGKSYNPVDFGLLFDLYDSRVRATKAAVLMAKHAKAPASTAPAPASRAAAVSPIVGMMRGRIARNG